MKIVKRLILAIIGVLILLLVMIYFLPGYDLRVVRSDSMKPVFSAGDMIVTVPLGSFFTREIKCGSIVTYDLGEELITHRVVSVDQDILVTKGDANEEADVRPVEISQISGIYLLKIPYVGYLYTFVRTKIGWFLAIILPGVLLVGLIVRDIIKEALRIDKPAKNAVGTSTSFKSSEKG